MRHYLGLDAGGTKTFCLAGDETGRVLGFGRAATVGDVGLTVRRPPRGG